METARNINFRKMLVEISNMLSERDFRSLKYMCHDVIPRGRLEDIEDPKDLWDALEERDKLSVHSTDFLKILLSSATEGRRDLVSLLQNYEHSNAPNMYVHVRAFSDSPRAMNGHTYQQSYNVRPQPLPPTPGLKPEIDFIVKHIGRDWRNFVRALGVCEADIDYISEQYPRDLREKIRQTLLLWENQYGAAASRDSIIEALKLCDRNDLVYQLSTGQY